MCGVVELARLVNSDVVGRSIFLKRECFLIGISVDVKCELEAKKPESPISCLASPAVGLEGLMLVGG